MSEGGFAGSLLTLSGRSVRNAPRAFLGALQIRPTT
jgi:hypothetical protein